MRKRALSLELTTGFGADKTATAVISGDADIAFMGTGGNDLINQ